MAKQILKQWAANMEAELRTTATTSNQVLATVDLGAIAGWSLDGVVFMIRGRVLSFEEDGGTDYTSAAEILARGMRRAGALSLTNAVDPNAAALVILGNALSAAPNFNVSGNTVQLRITPGTANPVRHFGRLFVDAYQYT